MDKITEYKVDSLPSAEPDQHSKLINDNLQGGWILADVTYKPPSRYSDGKFYFYFYK